MAISRVAGILLALALTLRLLQIKSAHTIPTIPTTDITITAIVPPLIFSFFVVVLLLLLRIGAVTFLAASGIEMLRVPVFSVVTAALADGCGCIELFAEDPAIDEALLLLLLLLVVVVLLLVVVVVVVVVVDSAVRVPVSVVVVVVVVVVVAVVHGFCCRVSVVNAGFFRNLQGQPSAPLLPSLMHCSISVRVSVPPHAASLLQSVQPWYVYSGCGLGHPTSSTEEIPISCQGHVLMRHKHFLWTETPDGIV